MSEATMFRPLSPEEVEAADRGHAAPADRPVPIVPVPSDAQPKQYRHPKRGAPSMEWPYHDAGGQVVGYVCRWDSWSVPGRFNQLRHKGVLGF